MKSVEYDKRVESVNGGACPGAPRKTVETVLHPMVAEYTSLKRGVNERFTRIRSAVGARHSAVGARRSALGSRLAFTLIELLVVIAIMSVLAALIIPITGAVTRHKLRSRTRTELRSIETAIEDYKTKRGYYPPDNPGSQFSLNQLYYELSGTVFSNGVYTTLDGSGVLNPIGLNPVWYGQGFNGIVNTTKGAGDEGMAAQKYIRELKPSQIGDVENGKVKILVGSVGWDSNVPLIPIPPVQPKLNPFRYISTNPTNNPRSFDLWIDIIVQGKTNRICNWSEDAIVL